ncbi:MAG: SDR family NAD(P)-dependent oxidoreductase [Brevibacterium sp.]
MPTAVVTGAASGMGLATVRTLADEGWRVIGIDIAEAGIEVDGTTFVRCDITDRDRLGDVLSEALGGPGAEGTRVDLVANIAGIFPPTTIETYTTETFRAVFDVNVLGTLNVTAEALKWMRSGSAVVNFASVDAFTVSPGQLVYGASKAAVVMATKSLALELADRGIRVNAIAPGWVDTPGNKATGRMAAAAAGVPLGRVAQPEEVARWVSILGSADAGFMTGETIVLSGGDVIR